MGTVNTSSSSCGDHPQELMMKGDMFYLCVVFLLVNAVSGIFFSTPVSSCSNDSQCRSFRRSRCLGTEFIFCFGRSETFQVSGACVPRNNFFCSIGNVVKGRRNNCNYNECAECLRPSDCGNSISTDYDCINYQCSYRDQNTITNTGK